MFLIYWILCVYCILLSLFFVVFANRQAFSLYDWSFGLKASNMKKKKTGKSINMIITNPYQLGAPTLSTKCDIATEMAITAMMMIIGTKAPHSFCLSLKCWLSCCSRKLKRNQMTENRTIVWTEISTMSAMLRLSRPVSSGDRQYSSLSVTRLSSAIAWK